MSLKVKAEKRTALGKNASRRFRREGKIPAVLYGKGEGGVPLVLDKKAVIDILKSESGENALFKTAYDSESKDTMIKEIQQDPVTEEILHIDLIQIAMDRTIKVSVPLVLAGEPVGVKAEGGFVDQVTREVEVECLPGDIPDQIEVDISGLHLNQGVKIEDVQPPEGSRIVTDPQTVVALVEAPTKEEVVEEEREEEEVEVMAEGEEPEVIKKEKAEEEEEKAKEEG